MRKYSIVALALLSGVATAYAGLVHTLHAPSIISLPGITYMALDGESCSNTSDPTTCTHNYFTRNGYTVAGTGALGGTSWDSMSFLINMVDYGVYTGQFPAFDSLYGSDHFSRISDLVSPGDSGGPDLGVQLTNNTTYALQSDGAGSSRLGTATGTTLTLDTAGFAAGPSRFVYASDGTNSIPNGTYLASGSGTSYTLSQAVTGCGSPPCILSPHTKIYEMTGWDQGAALPPPGLGTFTVAFHDDENDPIPINYSIPTSLANGGGRFLNWVATNSVYLYAGPSFTPMNIVLGTCPRYVGSTDPCPQNIVGLFGVDDYHFVYKQQTWGPNGPTAYDLHLLYNQLPIGQTYVNEEWAAIASHYGDEIDWDRCFTTSCGAPQSWSQVVAHSVAAPSRIPLCAYVENSNDPLVDNTGSGSGPHVSAQTLAGSNVLTFTTGSYVYPMTNAIKPYVYVGEQIYDATAGHIGYIPANTFITRVSATSITMSNAATTTIPIGDQLRFNNSYITPAEKNWVTWDLYIHNARCVIDFAYTGSYNSGPTPTLTEMQNTLASLNALAPVINSPTPLNYVISATDSWAGVNSSSYIFPKPAPKAFQGGIEVIAKSCNATGLSSCSLTPGVYLIATTRDIEPLTTYWDGNTLSGPKNIVGTFTIADLTATSCTPITIPPNPLTNRGSYSAVSGGVFTYTFADAMDVMICRVH